MYSFRDDDAMISKSRLKHQYHEPDWCTTPRQLAESREQYWGENRRGGNTVLSDERDTRIPLDNDNYKYSTFTGRSETISSRPLSPGPLSLSPRPLSPRALSPPPTLSPRQIPLHPKNQHLSRTEVASHMAAIKAVKESLNSDSRGGITVLKGLWKVFDAAVTELGTELQDSLSNKAIFEANVIQEKLNRQGKAVSDFGKKADTLLRQRHYEDMLKFTMLRLRGSFADLILGTKKELQKSIDVSFASRTVEMEKSFAKRTAEMEAKYTRQAFEAAQSFTVQLQETTEEKMMEIERLRNELTHRENELTHAQQVANMVQAQFSLHRDSTSTEIARLETELKQAELSREQTASIAQAQLMQERENHRQAIANSDSGRESLVTKLSSSLESLQVQCATVHNLEGKLREAEAKLHELQVKLNDTEEKLHYAEHERRQEKEAMEHQLSLVNETAYLLQNKLDGEIENKNALISLQNELEKRVALESERGGILQQKFDHEVKNTDALINVQKELEKHLEFERARGDLLQQELEIEIESKKEVVKSLHETSEQRNDERTGVMKELNRVSEQLRRANEERSSLETKHSGTMKELNHISEQLRRANEDRSSLETSLNILHAKCEEQDMDNSQLKSELNSVAQGKGHMESEVSRLSEQLLRAHEKESTVQANLNRLQARFEEQVRVIHESNAKYSHLESELQLSNDRVKKTTELSALLEDRVAELEAKIQDQLLDLEAARLSEVEVEKLLSDSLIEKKMLEEKLATLTAELEETMARLSTAESEYTQDRERFAFALQGFEEEMANAEAQMKSIFESNANLEAEKEAEKIKINDSQKEITNLKIIVQDLTDSLSKQTVDNAKQYETLKKNMEDEMQKQEDQFVKMKNECKVKVSKYESDIAVYEEAVKMLQKQVEILEELADSEREMCSKMAITNEATSEDLQEEIRKEFLARFDVLKAEHESAMATKDADIAALHEKCRTREVYIKQMERICVKVREDLLKRKEHKKKLLGSIERSIQQIKEAKQSKESTIYSDSGSTDIIEVVANEAVSFDSDIYKDFRSSILELTELDSFVGADLQMLLKSVDDEEQSE